MTAIIRDAAGNGNGRVLHTSRITSAASATRRRMRARALTAVLALSGCNSTEQISEPVQTVSEIVPARPGQVVNTAVLGWSTQLLWSTGDEILYTGRDVTGAFSQVRRIDINDGRIRMVDTLVTRGLLHTGIWITRDGRHTFFQRGSDLYLAVSDSTPVFVARATRPGSIPNSMYGGPVLPVGDGRIVHLGAADSVWTYDAQTRTGRFLGLGCRTLLVASPDGSQVLCLAVDNSFAVVNTATGITTPSAAVSGPVYAVYSIHWGSRGLEHVRSGIDWFTELVNESGAAMTLIRAEPFSLDGTTKTPSLQSFAWSRDGRALVWARRLCDYRGLTCERSQSQLLLFDIATRVTSIIAVTEREIGNIAFSPDGRRVAYVAHSAGGSAQMYVASTQ